MLEHARWPFGSLDEIDGPQEILVVIVLVRLVVQRVHLVGSCREQQDPHFGGVVLVFEQALCQRGRLVVAIQQRFEALEFVENDEVGFEGVDTGGRQEATELADQGGTFVPIFFRDVLSDSLKTSDNSESIESLFLRQFSISL